MNCEEIQRQLSDYVERSLGASPMGLIEEHLSDCPPCRREVEMLGETIGQIAALPMVEPPLGFTQRVMAHVRETEARPTSWRWFLQSLRSKFPVQAIAVVVVGVLGIYLLHNEPQKPSTPAPGNIAADAVKQDSVPAGARKNSNLANSAYERSTQLSAPLSAPQLRSTPRREGAQIAEKPMPQSTKNSSVASAVPVPPTPATAAERQNTSGLLLERGASNLTPGPSPGGRVTSIVSGTPIASPTYGQPVSNPSNFSFPSELDSAAFKSAPLAIEPFADYELVVRRHPHQSVEQGGNSVGAPQRSEAANTDPDRPPAPRAIDRLMAAIPDRTRPQTIWVNVPQNQFDEFIKELAILGAIESQTRVPLLRDQPSPADGQIRVRLTALPARDPKDTNASTGR
jgi:anti-sigma factor RsiW